VVSSTEFFQQQPPKPPCVRIVVASNFL
jgi:hypothetical protein